MVTMTMPSPPDANEGSWICYNSVVYDFATLFSRQVQGLSRAGDCLIAHTGRDVGGLAPLADLAVIVPSDVTARNQEAHILIRPAWCKSVETALAAQEVQAP